MGNLTFKSIVLLFAFLTALIAEAHDFEQDGVYYIINGENSVSVSYRGDNENSFQNEYEGEVNIPSEVEYNGKIYMVTSIGIYAFQECDRLISVSIPNTVTVIDYRSFYFCTRLSSINLPPSLVEIGYEAFAFCRKLTTIDIPDSVTKIVGRTFYATGITSVKIPERVTEINYETFAACKGLSSVIIPDSLITIGEMAFNGCENLTSVTIGSSVKDINAYAFNNCNISKITIPKSVESIGVNVFASNDDFSEIIVDNGNNYYSDIDGVLFNKKQTTLVMYPSGKTDTMYSIPGNVSKIEDYAFNDCSHLRNISIPNSVLIIGESAFEDCAELEEIVIPDSVMILDKRAFKNCMALRKVAMGDSLDEISEETFYNCLRLESVKIPDSVTRVSYGAFVDCHSLAEVDLGNSITEIGMFAFMRCSSLKSIIIPNTVEEIGTDAFYSCDILNATLGSSLRLIGNGIFSHCDNLATITSLAQTPPKCDEFFDSYGGDNGSLLYDNVCLIVPTNSLDGYKNTSVWSKFRNITDGLVRIDTTELSINTGDHYKLMATVFSVDNDTSVVWTSSNLGVTTVTPDGLVKALFPGEAIITATSTTGASAECEVIVRQPVLGIGLNLTDVVLMCGDTTTIKAILLPDYATDQTVSWSSSDYNVVSVTRSGLITTIEARDIGEAIITATASNGITAECKVTVLSPVMGIMLNSTEITIPVGDAITLEATVSPQDAYDRSVRWSSSDESIATVDDNGLVTAVSSGEVNITVTASNGLTAECRVTVLQPVTGIELNVTEITIQVGDTVTIEATVSPADASDKEVRWSSSDESVATVDDNGLFTAVSSGEVTITATTSNGLTAECKVTVLQPVTDIELNATELILTVGHTFTLEAIVLPENATDKTVAWSSSDDTVASVNDRGIVSAKSSGEITITATTSNGLTAVCSVKVIQLIESLIIEPALISLEVGESIQLEAVISPSDADNTVIDWMSMNQDIAIVSDNGLVTAVGEGVCEIYATTTDGSNLIASCHLTSTSGVESIFEDSMTTHDIYTLNGMILKKDATVEDFEKLLPGIYIIGGRKVHKR